MANTIKIKAGSGTPTTSDIVDKELAFDRSADKLYINDNGTIVDLTGSGATGDIEGVTAGNGLTGGGTSGTVTLNIGAGTGIDVAADAISVDVSDFMSNGVNNRILTATGSDAMNAEANLTWNGSDYFNITSADGAEGGIKLLKSSTDATHTAYHISHRDDNQSLIIYSYDGTTFRNWITLDEPNALLKLGSDSSNLVTINSSAQIAAASLDISGDVDVDGTMEADAITVNGTTLNEHIQDTVGAMFSSNTETRISATYQDGDGTIDLVVDDMTANDNTVTTNIAGTGIDVSSGTGNSTISVDVSDFMSNGSNNRIVTATGTDAMNAEANFTIDGTSLQLGDSKILSLGNSDDLQIHHTTNQNYIDINTGNLTFRDDGDNNVFRINKDGGADLLEGDLTLPATEKLYLDGGSNTYITESSADRVKIFVGGDEMLNLIEGSTNVVRVEDDVLLGAGNSTDMYMQHTGGHSYIYNGTGNLNIVQQVDDGDLILMSDDGSGGNTAYLTLDGSAESIEISKKMQFPASHSADKIVMYSGGNEKIGTEANTLLFTADNYKFKDTNGDVNLFMNNSGKVGIAETSLDANLHITGSPVVVKLERAGHRAMRFGTPDNSSKFIFADSDDLKSNIAIEIDSSRDVKITESVGIGVAANGTAGRLDCSNDVVAFSSSDERLKENIKPLDNALDKVLKISGVEFDWKELTEEEKKTIHGNQGHDVGVIAQEVEEVLPEVVTTRDSGYKAVKYEKLVPLLIESIKELKEEVNGLKDKFGE